MKKIFTLAVALGTMTALFAQDNHRDDYPLNNRDESRTVIFGQDNYRDVYDNDRHNHNFSFFGKERDFQIQHINREFDIKIMEVRTNPYLRNREKRWQIRSLEDQRQQQIMMINQRYYNGRDRLWNERWNDERH